MKKKLFLILILLVEVALFVVTFVYNANTHLTFLEPIYQLMVQFQSVVVDPIANLLKLSDFAYGPLLVVLLLNVAFIIVYYLIFGTLTLIINSSKKKKVERVVRSHYVLSPSEEERFSYHNYMKKFPKVRFFSLIIPLLVFVIFAFASFDKAFCESLGVTSVFELNIYSNHIQPIITSFLGNDNIVKILFTNPAGIGYFDLVLKLPENLLWVEFVILFFLLVILLGLWFGLLTLLYLPFRKACAKRKAKKAREKYIFKQDYREYKLRTKNVNNYSTKSDEFMSALSESEEEQHLAKVDSTNPLNKEDLKPADYYDDLGHGVRNLGVGDNLDEKKDKAIIEREVRYISDKDFDIELEAEPVIEVVEEDSLGQLRHTNEDELFYEKYQPDDIKIKSFEEYSKDHQSINDYVSNIQVEETKEIENKDLVEEPTPEEIKPVEEVAVEKYEEEPVEEVTPTAANEVKEEPIEEVASEEESIKEETTEPSNDNNDEKENDSPQEISLDNLSPLERYRIQRKEERERLEKERQALIEAGTLTEDNDPLRKYRKPGARAGKVEARVPTNKEQEILKQASIIEKKQNRNKK